MVMGIVAAILVAVVVIFVFSRLTGLFLVQDRSEQGNRSGHQRRTNRSINVSLADDQTYMPNVLGLPKDMQKQN